MGDPTLELPAVRKRSRGRWLALALAAALVIAIVWAPAERLEVGWRQKPELITPVSSLELVLRPGLLSEHTLKTFAEGPGGVTRWSPELRPQTDDGLPVHTVLARDLAPVRPEPGWRPAAGAWTLVLELVPRGLSGETHTLRLPLVLSSTTPAP